MAANPLGVYIKLFTRFPGDRKVRELAQFGEEGGLAMLLYVLMALYCKEQANDGEVPSYVLPLLAVQGHIDPEHVEALAKHLLSVGLINLLSTGSYLVPAYAPINGSHDEAQRLHDARVQAGRMGGSRPRKGAAHHGRRASAEASAKQPAKQMLSSSLSQSRGEDIESSGPPNGGPDDDSGAPAGAHAHPRDLTPDRVIEAVHFALHRDISPGQARKLMDRLPDPLDAIHRMNGADLDRELRPERTDAWSDVGGQRGAPGPAQPEGAEPSAPPRRVGGNPDRHPSSRSARDVLAEARGEGRVPATDEQRAKHADEIRHMLASRTRPQDPPPLESPWRKSGEPDQPPPPEPPADPEPPF